MSDTSEAGDFASVERAVQRLASEVAAPRKGCAARLAYWLAKPLRYANRFGKVERTTGFEPATLSLEGSCSTS